MLGDYELAEVSHTTHPKARREHLCGECRRAIPTGDTYERTKGLWAGGWCTYKTCNRCVEYRTLHGSDGDGSFGYGELGATLQEGCIEVYEDWRGEC